MRICLNRVDFVDRLGRKQTKNESLKKLLLIKNLQVLVRPHVASFGRGPGGRQGIVGDTFRTICEGHICSTHV